MKRFRCIALLFLPVLAGAQDIPRSDPGAKLFGRMGFSASKSVSEGLTLRAGSELRYGDALFNYIRLDGSTGVVWSPLPWLSVSTDCTFIGRCENRHDLSCRLRLSTGASAQWDSGAWRFCAKEKLQLTHRPGDMNTWQAPRNALVSKTEAKVSYRIDKHWRPYAAFELRVPLNAVRLSDYGYDSALMSFVTPEGAAVGEPGWMVEGFGRAYVNRIRFEPGVKYRMDKHHSLRLYALADYRTDRKVNISRDGTRLKSIVDIPEYDFSLGLAWSVRF